ncbi:MAG: hypothetical protein ABW133_23930, partial [Polyangiaceae bacterium]
LIQQQAHEDANIIWGASIDETAGAPPMQSNAQSSLPIRERMTLPVGMDSEWDTPTFQRRSGQ